MSSQPPFTQQEVICQLLLLLVALVLKERNELDADLRVSDTAIVERVLAIAHCTIRLPEDEIAARKLIEQHHDYWEEQQEGLRIDKFLQDSISANTDADNAISTSSSSIGVHTQTDLTNNDMNKLLPTIAFLKDEVNQHEAQCQVLKLALQKAEQALKEERMKSVKAASSDAVDKQITKIQDDSSGDNISSRPYQDQQPNGTANNATKGRDLRLALPPSNSGKSSVLSGEDEDTTVEGLTIQLLAAKRRIKELEQSSRLEPPGSHQSSDNGTPRDKLDSKGVTNKSDPPVLGEEQGEDEDEIKTQPLSTNDNAKRADPPVEPPTTASEDGDGTRRGNTHQPPSTDDKSTTNNDREGPHLPKTNDDRSATSEENLSDEDSVVDPTAGEEDSSENTSTSSANSIRSVRTTESDEERNADPPPTVAHKEEGGGTRRGNSHQQSSTDDESANEGDAKRHDQLEVEEPTMASDEDITHQQPPTDNESTIGSNDGRGGDENDTVVSHPFNDNNDDEAASSYNSSDTTDGDIENDSTSSAISRVVSSIQSEHTDASSLFGGNTGDDENSTSDSESDSSASSSSSSDDNGDVSTMSVEHGTASETSSILDSDDEAAKSDSSNTTLGTASTGFGSAGPLGAAEERRLSNRGDIQQPLNIDEPDFGGGGDDRDEDSKVHAPIDGYSTDNENALNDDSTVDSREGAPTILDDDKEDEAALRDDAESSSTLTPVNRDGLDDVKRWKQEQIDHWRESGKPVPELLGPMEDTHPGKKNHAAYKFIGNYMKKKRYPKSGPLHDELKSAFEGTTYYSKIFGE